jgi:threonylcarbamoyladenosine tRNA methylthiotransferase MtaB
VQDGCRYSCTFCIVTKTRGSERSKKLCDVINEINQIQKQGIKEVILTGVHIGGYGSDINTNLVSLIRAILKETDIPRIRLGSVEPWDLDFDFINLFSNPRLMPHLHLPLQSGSDTVLRRMARRCKTENFAKLLTRLHACVPNFNITTDVIVGFPGESDNEWLESLAYIKSCNFSHIHIFPYSQRHGTLAANMPNQIAPALKKARIQELNSLAVEMRKSALEKYSGLETLVLIENQMGTTTNGKQAYLGYTPNYIKVRLISDCELPFKNEIIKVRLDGYDRQSSLMNGILANPVKSLQNLA